MLCCNWFCAKGGRRMQLAINSPKIKKSFREHIKNKDKHRVELFCQISEINLAQRK